MTDRPLRIALVSYHTSPFEPLGTGDAGGMNVVIANQARALAAAGHDVEIFTRRSDPASPEITQVCDRLTLRLLPAGEPRRYPKSELDQFIPAFSAALADIARTRHWDVMHSHHWMSGLAAEPVASGLGLPHVFSYHSIAAPVGSPLDAGEPAETPARLRGEGHLARMADRIVAISRWEAATIVERCGGNDERISIVEPGVDSETFHPRAPGEEPDRPYLALAARLQPLKGVDLALAALAAVPAADRPDLIVSGEASADFAAYAGNLRDLAARLGVADRVEFIGPCDRPCLSALMRRSAMLLVPSYAETYGLVALEGSASGVPVVAHRATGLLESVVDGTTGLLVGRRSPEAWAAAITALLRDPARRASLGAAGRRRAEHLTWERSAARLSRVYEGLLA